MALSSSYKKKYSYVNNQRIVKIQRTIDLLAYGSLLLDVCIAAITFLSLINIKAGEQMLGTIHFTLTAVVVMSLTSFSMLLYMKHYERIMAEVLRIKCRIKLPLTSPRLRYSLKWTLRDRWKKLRKFLGR
jgi:hypothetical protein